MRARERIATREEDKRRPKLTKEENGKLEEWRVQKAEKRVERRRVERREAKKFKGTQREERNRTGKGDKSTHHANE